MINIVCWANIQQDFLEKHCIYYKIHNKWIFAQQNQIYFKVTYILLTKYTGNISYQFLLLHF
jgi:hypothetical protein